ncbi:hypothetical protein BGX27_000096 [Mortierella sp. AM989]|nr:hypothetical protein BGX27_000096 [Mortierella sp. AM989]
MHSLAACPLRTFCCITTTNSHPFHILHLDNAALDLILAGGTVMDQDTLDCSDFDSLTELRTEALEYLKGRSISEIILPDPDSCLAPSAVTIPDIRGCSNLQPFTIAEHAFSELSKNDHTLNSSNFRNRPPKSNQVTRRFHGCIHSSVPYSSPLNLSQTPNSLVPSLQSHIQREPQPDQHTLCRVYALRDVTEIHSLALAAKNELWYRHRRQRFLQSPRSTRSTAPTLPSVLSCSDRTDPHSKSVTYQKSYSAESRSDWASLQQNFRHSFSSCSSASCSPPYSSTASSTASSVTSSRSTSPSLSPLHISNVLPETHKKLRSTYYSKDLGLLLLQVTRFGTIDHAYVISEQLEQQQQQQQKQTKKPLANSFLARDKAAIEAMINSSVMSYAHPDDVRTLCRGLDQVCRSQDRAFHIRWSLQGNDQHRDRDDSIATNVYGLSTPRTGHSRTIEYKGELFEEWIDPTAAKTQGHKANESEEQLDQNKYFWTEIKGIQSNGQPLLIVRPLSNLEIQEQYDNTSILSAPVTDALPPLERIEHKSGKEWKSKTKRMGSEERMNLPRRLGVSALTSLSVTPRQTRQDELILRMPGSLPPHMIGSQLQHSSQMSLSTSTCYSTGGIINIPSILAYPANSSPSWPMFVTIAFDAWKKWSQTVHAGQAQFHDWCEYVLETTIDQLIESLSLGLMFLGVENCPNDLRLEEEQNQVSAKVMHNTDCHKEKPAWEGSTNAKRQQQQMLSGGMRRVGKILHNYPTVECVVLTFGNSWLGRRIKSRLEHKLLDRAADQVVEWWYSSEGGEAMPLDMPSQTNKPVGSANVDSFKANAVIDAAVNTTEVKSM